MDITPSEDSAAEAEVYISEIAQKASEYIDNGPVWNREELKGALETVFKKGTREFCCLLGGKSTGKSLVLSELMSRNRNHSIAYVDLKDGGGILQGLLSSLEGDPPTNFYDIIRAALEKLSIKFPVGFSFTAGLSVRDLLKYFTAEKEKSDAQKLSVLLSQVAEKGAKNAKGCGLTVVVDEANAAFTDINSSQRDAARETLLVFIKLTKQTHKVSIL